MHCHPRPRPNHCHPRPNHCMKPTSTQMMPAQIHPTQHNIVEKTCEYIVPEVYPTHTTNVVNHVYKHVKSFPQTQSNQQNISNQQFMAQGAPVAGASFGPQSVGPAMGGPVAGAMMPQGSNMMPQGVMPQGSNMMAPMGTNGPVMGAMSPMHGQMHHKHCGCGCRRR